MNQSMESFDSNIGGGEIDPETGLAPDYINTWMQLGFLVREINDLDKNDEHFEFNQNMIDISIDELNDLTLPTYTEYCSDKPGILEKSDPDKVVQIDSVATQWNMNKEGFLKDKKFDELEKVWNLVSTLVRGENGK